MKQIMELATAIDIKGIIGEKQSDRYYKSFGSMTQLVTMLFGILSRCDSMTEVCEGLRGMGGKLNHLGLKKSPAKSTASDGLRNRDNGFFEAVYFSLVKHYRSFLSDSRTFGLTFKEVLLVDSTTIRLFSDILKGVGRNPKGDGKKKGGLKVHMLIDAVQSVGRFVKITEAKVLRDEIISVSYHPEDENGKKITKETCELTLRRVSYQDEKNRRYEFLTNNMDITAEEVAFLYKKRWTIELLFKKMKQNFQLNYFYGENTNAIYTQVWCTLIAQLLLTVLQKKAQVKKAFSVVATLVRIHLISLLDVYQLLKSGNRDYNAREGPQDTGQLALF